MVVRVSARKKLCGICILSSEMAEKLDVCHENNLNMWQLGGWLGGSCHNSMKMC